MSREKIKVDIFLASLAIASLLLGSFVVYRKNRILNGTFLPAISTSSKIYALLAGGFLVAFAMTAVYAFLNKTLNYKQLLLPQSMLLSLAIFCSLMLLGKEALYYDRVYGHLSRVSPGYSFWVFEVALLVLLKRLFTRTDNLKIKLPMLIFVASALLVPMFAGSLSKISVAKEYFNNAEIFKNELKRHIFLSSGSVLIAILTGVPAGWFATKNQSFYSYFFRFLNLIQVIPTLSLIGFLMIPLSWIGDRFYLAKLIGLRGVGWGPALIVLTLYAIYPIARNTAAAISSIASEYTEVAFGIGLSAPRVFFEIELPLVASVVLAGVRVALVQASAGTILAALLGGGGLGVFIFLGMAQTAQDLVLLGLLPIIALSFLYHSIVNLVEKYLFRSVHYGINTGS